ncbi:MAG: hypothetical protein K6E29_05795 [Cyanobacteria bacterium RUI128]|nr:hypothetical protein [Cyanobacteria bacterium RUI128]
MTGILNVQITPIIGNKEANLRKVEHFIGKFADKNLDLVILPEFFSTGIHHDSFLNSPEPEDGGKTIQSVCELAKKYNTNIVAGTVIEKENDKLYNTSFIIDRSGKVVDKYRKIHLYNYMGGTEGERITPGDKLVTVDFDFGRIGLGICFDIRYPLHYKELAKTGVDIIVLPTAWLVPNEIYEDKTALTTAQDMWLAMNRTRAYDNLVYIVSCNQTGKCNDNVSCIGNSLVIAPTTEVLSNAKNEQGGFFAEIDLNAVKLYRTIYPISTID